NAAVQKIPPITSSSSSRTPAPWRSRVSRASTLRHLGSRMMPIPASRRIGSLPEDDTELLLRDPTGELEEEVFQRDVPRRGVLSQLRHGASHHQPPVLNEPNVVAHRFAHLRGMVAL